MVLEGLAVAVCWISGIVSDSQALLATHILSHELSLRPDRRHSTDLTHTSYKFSLQHDLASANVMRKQMSSRYEVAGTLSKESRPYACHRISRTPRCKCKPTSMHMRHVGKPSPCSLSAKTKRGPAIVASSFAQPVDCTEDVVGMSPCYASGAPPSVAAERS